MRRALHRRAPPDGPARQTSRPSSTCSAASATPPSRGCFVRAPWRRPRLSSSARTRSTRRAARAGGPDEEAVSSSYSSGDSGTGETYGPPPPPEWGDEGGQSYASGEEAPAEAAPTGSGRRLRVVRRRRRRRRFGGGRPAEEKEAPAQEAPSGDSGGSSWWPFGGGGGGGSGGGEEAPGQEAPSGDEGGGSSWWPFGGGDEKPAGGGDEGGGSSWWPFGGGDEKPAGGGDEGGGSSWWPFGGGDEERARRRAKRKAVPRPRTSARKIAEGETGSESDEFVPMGGGARPVAGPGGFHDDGSAGIQPYAGAATRGEEPEDPLHPHAFMPGGATGTVTWSGGGGEGKGPKGNQESGSFTNEVVPKYDSNWGGIRTNASAFVESGNGHGRRPPELRHERLRRPGQRLVGLAPSGRRAHGPRAEARDEVEAWSTAARSSRCSTGSRAARPTAGRSRTGGATPASS